MPLNKTHKIYPFFYNGRYYNYPGEPRPPFLLPPINMIIEWYFFKKFEKRIDANQWTAKDVPVDEVSGATITWIGHSTFLIQINGINILTDPIFTNLLPLFPRLLPPGITLKNLPKIDFVLISHNHRDHMDNHTLTYLRDNHKCKYLVPIGDKAWFDSKGFENVFELFWWDNIKFSKVKYDNDIEFVFLPAAHWSQRGLFDYNKSLWGSWMIKTSNKNIYFGGDSSYSSHYLNIAQEFPRIDMAIMPIGPCEPRQWMKYSHMNAEEAGQAFLDLRAKQFVPMHWGTYFFGIDGFNLPIERLMAWWESKNMNFEDLHLLKVGQRKALVFPEDSVPYQPTNLIIQETNL